MGNIRNTPCACGSGKKYKNCCLLHEGKYTIFCDESGNSGGNYLDQDQPFYIIAGWIVPNKNKNNASYIKKCAQELGVNGELHGTKLIKRKRAQNEFVSLFQALGNEVGCIPTFIFAEKKYCIAAKIIETLLDPVYNDEVDNSYTFDNLKKKALAEEVYSLPDHYLSEFILSYNAADANAMEQCINKICDCMDSIGKIELSNILRGSLKYIEENLKTEKTSHESLPNKTMMSLNLPVYISYISLLEKLGRDINYLFELVHDKTKQFEVSYNQVFSMYSQADNFEFPLTDGNSVIMGFNHLRKFSFMDSKDSEWIQSADLLGSVLSRILKQIYFDEKLEGDLLKLAKLTLPALMVKELKFADSICSDQTRNKIFTALNTLSKPV